MTTTPFAMGEAVARRFPSVLHGAFASFTQNQADTTLHISFVDPTSTLYDIVLSLTGQYL